MAKVTKKQLATYSYRAICRTCAKDLMVTMELPHLPRTRNSVAKDVVHAIRQGNLIIPYIKGADIEWCKCTSMLPKEQS